MEIKKEAEPLDEILVLPPNYKDPDVEMFDYTNLKHCGGVNVKKVMKVAAKTAVSKTKVVAKIAASKTVGAAKVAVSKTKGAASVVASKTKGAASNLRSRGSGSTKSPTSTAIDPDAEFDREAGMSSVGSAKIVYQPEQGVNYSYDNLVFDKRTFASYA